MIQDTGMTPYEKEIDEELKEQDEMGAMRKQHEKNKQHEKHKNV